MEFPGGFHEGEIDDKPYLVYHHMMFDPTLQRESPTSPVEAASHDHPPPQRSFLCPDARWQVSLDYSNTSLFKCFTEGILTMANYPDTNPSIDYQKVYGHPVFPLFWCNNKEFQDNGGCNICSGSNFGTDYYLCAYGKIYHKECIKAPPKINHPYHRQHSLRLNFQDHDDPIECLCCGRRANYLVYHCTICQVFMHPICAMKSIPFFIEKPKRHQHPLTFFPRQTCLTCNVCGLLRKNYPTYICARCNFVAHTDCMYSPGIIKISRHHHRISHVSSLRAGEWYCGVCRQSIDGDYGAYHCDKCSDYAVHSRCALRKDVCDGVELEGVPEEDDILLDDGPFEMISEGVILYFLHDHHLRLEVSILYDENKICKACCLPIFEGNFYSCMECDFILHETCTQAPRRIQHALHPHPLTLRVCNTYYRGPFLCDACGRGCGGFVYQCSTLGCDYDLDVRCASISEPFYHKGHEHPLFLALDPREKSICQVCESECEFRLNCIKSDFIICIKCATLPYKARYEHDTHFLTIIWGEEICEKDWCELCERKLKDTSTKYVYWCNICCTTIHIKCLFGEDPYLRPGQFFELNDKEVQILSKSKFSRPLCHSCIKPCEDKRFIRDYHIACSIKCGINIF